MIADLECQCTHHDETAAAIRRWLDERDQRAATWLVARYRPFVIHAVAGWLPRWWMAEDVVQEVFARAFTALHRFDPARSFDAWLATIARNTCAKTLRSLSRRGAMTSMECIDADDECAEQVPPADESLLRRERARQVRLLFAWLPRADQRVLILYRIHDLPADEVARRTGATACGVRIRALRAQNELRCRAAEMIRAGDL